MTTTARTDSALALLEDEHKLTQMMYTYAHGADRGNMQVVRSGYTDDAYDDHGPMSGPVDKFVENMRSNHEKNTFGALQHFIWNVIVEVAGDRAVSESYFICFAGTPNEVKPQFLAGRYVDRLVRTDGGWRVKLRTVVFDWTLNLAQGFSSPAVSTEPLGSRDEADLGSIALRGLVP